MGTSGWRTHPVAEPHADTTVAAAAETGRFATELLDRQADASTRLIPKSRATAVRVVPLIAAVILRCASESGINQSLNLT